MAHGYRILQHWNDWLAQDFLGQSLLHAEKEILERLLNNHFGKHALLIGMSQQYDLLNTTPVLNHTLLTPLCREKLDQYIESDFHELPILTGSIDLVMLPHTLELIDNPRQLLHEACRIIKPEGLILICGFNPYSMWGLRKFFPKQPKIPWKLNFIHQTLLKNWLLLADFEIEKYQSILFTPPLSQEKIYNKFKFLELFGKFIPFLNGAYVMVARAKVVPLTPIRLQWKQQLNGIRVSNSFTGHVARTDSLSL